MNFFSPKTDQNSSFLKYHIFALPLLIRGIHTFGSISETMFHDPRKGRIEKILLNFVQNFLTYKRVYTVIYGTCF
jgi:hypothetical protein